MRLFLAALWALLLTEPASAQNIPPSARTTLQPAGKWTIDYADWQCILRRDFTMDGKPTHFWFTLEPVTSKAWLRIGTEDRGVTRDQGRAVLFTDGDRQGDDFHYNIYQAGRLHIREYMLDLDQHQIGAAKDRIRLWSKSHGDIDVPAENFQQVWAAMTGCMSDLYRDLEIDQAELARVAAEPEGSIFDAASLPRGKELQFAVIYWVNTDGKVDDCRLLSPSGIETFDASLCDELIKKGRFKPARDRAGAAMRAPKFENVSIRTAIVNRLYSIP